MKKRYNFDIGYSGHEFRLGTTVAAVYLGATYLQRHITLDRTMKGPDHASSVEPTGMELVIIRSKRLFTALGTSEKRVLDSELDNRKKFRGY